MRFFGLLLVGVLLVLPSLVRVTQHVSASQDSAPIRLNRGFDQPQAKCRVAPPDDHIVLHSEAVDDAVVAHAPAAAPVVEERIPVLPAIPAPEPLRGPPARIA